MEIVTKIMIDAILLAILTCTCCYCIGRGINKTLLKKVNKQKELNSQLLSLFQNEKSKTDTLYKIIFHIRQQLSLLKLKECPEEEFKNIPFEIIEWINMLEKVSTDDER